MAKWEIIAVGELNPDWQSRAIQRGIMADYSHIAILFTDDSGEQCVFESIGKGTVKSTVAEVLDNGKAVIRHRFTVPVLNNDFSLGWCHGRLGGRYSLIQYLGFIFPFMRRFKWIRNGRAFSVCSEFGADFLVDCANLIHDKLNDCDFVSPTDLVYICQEVYGRG